MDLPRIPNEVIFSVMRSLKAVNPGDLYYEAYLGHYNKYKESFQDTYHFAWQWAIAKKPKSILEIGVRTGISICQLLSAYIDLSVIDRIVLCDLFGDGYSTPGLVKLNLSHLNILKSVESKIEFVVGDSRVKIPEWQQAHPDVKFDYILVDGSHEKVDAKQDLTNVCSLINQGGVIVFDDIGPDGVALADVWEYFKSIHSTEFEFTENFNGKGIGTAVKK